MSSAGRVIALICGLLVAGVAALIGVGVVVWLVVSGRNSSRPGPESIPAVASNTNEYALAQVEPFTVGDVVVRVKHWSIRRVPGLVHGEHKDSPEECLIVNLQVSTDTPDKVFEFESWHKPRERNEDGFRAVDEVGNHYDRVRFPSDFQFKGEIDRELVTKNEPVLDRIVMEKPHRSAREIRVTLPSRNVTGVDGPDIRFRIELKRKFKDEHGQHEFDPRDLPPATEGEVHRQAEKADHERPARDEEIHRQAERAHEEEMRRQADREAEEQAARRAERELQRKRDADAAAVRAEMEEKAKEKERAREAEKRVEKRLDQDERDAATLLKLARQYIDTDKPDKAMAAKKLTEIIEKYPNTEAAKEAKKLRAGL